MSERKPRRERSISGIGKLGIAGLMYISASIASAQNIGDTVYAKRDGTELQDASGKTTVAKVNATQPMRVISVDGSKVQVKTADGKTGFLAKLRVTTTAPKGASKLGIKDDTRPAERGNVSSIRGLNPMAQSIVDSGQATQAAKEDTETIKKLATEISADEVKQFAAEGGVEQK